MRPLQILAIGATWCAAIILLGMCVMGRAPARELYVGQYDDVPNHIRSWFKSVRSPRGIPCCDIADGHSTTWQRGLETEENSGFEVPIGETPDGKPNWVPVPKQAVVYNAGNPTGEAVVWYVRQGDESYYIRCFVPGDGV
jgi:hypothetical protein